MKDILLDPEAEVPPRWISLNEPYAAVPVAQNQPSPESDHGDVRVGAFDLLPVPKLTNRIFYCHDSMSSIPWIRSVASFRRISTTAFLRA